MIVSWGAMRFHGRFTRLMGCDESLMRPHEVLLWGFVEYCEVSISAMTVPWWGFMGCHERFMKCHEVSWSTMRCYEVSWGFANVSCGAIRFHEVSWKCHGVSWSAMRCYKRFMNCHEPWGLMRFMECHGSPMKRHKVPWGAMRFCEVVWSAMSALWSATRFHESVAPVV